MNPDELKRKLGIDDEDTYRVDPETGRVQKEGLFGWKDTETRLDPESGTIQKEGLFGWKDTETRINPDSGVVQKEGVFGHRDTDTRVDPKTGTIQKEGLFGWKDSDERIDPDTGEHQVRGLFGWKQKGWHGDKYTRHHGQSRDEPKRIPSRQYESISDDGSDAAEGLSKLVVGLVIVGVVVWFITGVVIPLLVINLASIALVAGLLKKQWRKILFPLSILGAIYLMIDYNNRWATETLSSNVSFFVSWIKPFLYINLAAGLTAAYFTVNAFLDARGKPTDDSDVSKRNAIIIGCLALAGGITIAGQTYVDSRSWPRATGLTYTQPSVSLPRQQPALTQLRNSPSTPQPKPGGMMAQRPAPASPAKYVNTSEQSNRPAPDKTPATLIKPRVDMGVVASVSEIRKAGAGTLAGTVIGGVVGHQVGHGNGKTAATLLGALGGAVLGHVAENQVTPAVSYKVIVNLDAGGQRTFVVESKEGLAPGGRVRIAGNELHPY